MTASPVSPRDAGPYVTLAASPRPGGNTDAAARFFLEGFSRAGASGGDGRAPIPNAGMGRVPQPVYLRSHRVEPCVSCHACAHAARNTTARDPEETGASGPEPLPRFGCPLTAGDDSAPLLDMLANAAGLCLVAPIYFYHLPAALKALVDRTQPFWALREAGVTRYSGQKPRTCHVILLAARTRGEKLFEGSLLTLKYALEPLTIRLAEPLLLHGLENPPDLLGQPGAIRSIVAYGEKAAKQL